MIRKKDNFIQSVNCQKCQIISIGNVKKLEFSQSDQVILIFWNQCMLLVWGLTKHKTEKISFYFPWRYRNHYWPVNVSCWCPDNKYLHPLIPKKWNVLKNWRFGMWLNHCHENKKLDENFQAKRHPKYL